MAQHFLEGQECISWLVDVHCLAAKSCRCWGRDQQDSSASTRERKKKEKENKTKKKGKGKPGRWRNPMTCMQQDTPGPLNMLRHLLLALVSFPVSLSFSLSLFPFPFPFFFVFFLSFFLSYSFSPSKKQRT